MSGWVLHFATAQGRHIPGVTPIEARLRGDGVVRNRAGNLDNWRWRGVPFYLRTGKRLPHQTSMIAIRSMGFIAATFPTHPAHRRRAPRARAQRGCTGYD